MQSYQLQKKEFIASLQSTIMQYRHESGAEVLFLQNEDPHRVFSINFKTPPQNDKGIPHILEHIILNGSKLYCKEDPFSLLMRNALYSYLNAMTFKDKTIYTAASYEKKEFEKIFHVYLDCIFNPLLRHKDFLQEGLQMRIEDSADVVFSGVVYNEMTGVYSNETIWQQYKTFQQLFAHHFQQYDSAGVPQYIQNVSYEEVLAYYQTYYTKNNCFIYLYGDIPIEETLEYLHTHYLGVQTRMEAIGTETSTTIPPVEKKRRWGITKNAVGQTFQDNMLMMAYRLDGISNQQLMALEILLDSLFYRAEESFVKQLENQYGITGWQQWINKDGSVPVLMVQCHCGTATPKKIHRRWLGFCAQEIRIESLTYSIEKKAYEVCKRDYGYKPKGLWLLLQFMQCWMVHKSFSSEIDPQQWIDALQESENPEQVFQQAVQQFILDNHNFVCNWFTAAEEQKEMRSIPKEISNIALSRKTMEELLLNPKYEDKGTIGYIPIAPKGLATIYCYFHPKPCGEYYYGILGLVRQWLLKKEMDGQTGGFLGEQHLRLVETRTDDVLLLWSFTGKARDQKAIFSQSQQILAYVCNTDLATLRSFLAELYTTLKAQFSTKVEVWAGLRAQGQLKKSAQWMDEFEGLGFYLFVTRLYLSNEIDNAFLVEFHKVFNEMFGVPYEKWDVTCEEAEKNEWISALEQLHYQQQQKNIHSIHVGTNQNVQGSTIPTKSFFCTQQDVFTNAYTFQFQNGLDGFLLLAMSILQKGILHERLRNEGGCYFVGLSYTWQGLVTFHTIQDPNFSETYQGFGTLVAQLLKESITENQLQGYKTEVLNQWLRPKHPLVMGWERLHQQIQGMDRRQLLQWYEDITTATVAQVKQHFSEAMKQVTETSCVSIGNLERLRPKEHLYLENFEIFK